MKVKSILFQLALVIAAVSFAAGASASPMYKWTDKDGTVHYTETPPEEGNATTIAPPPHVTPPPASAQKGPNSNAGESPDSKGNKADKEEAALTPEQRDIYARNCEAAKANLDLFQKSSRYQQTDGKVIEMDDELRQKKISQAEEQVKRYCK